MWAKVTETNLIAPNIAILGILLPFSLLQMAIDGSKYLEQTHENNFDLVLENLGIFRVRNWSGLSE